jgi:hypothetical protein
MRERLKETKLNIWSIMLKKIFLIVSLLSCSYASAVQFVVCYSMHGVEGSIERACFVSIDEMNQYVTLLGGLALKIVDLDEQSIILKAKIVQAIEKEEMTLKVSYDSQEMTQVHNESYSLCIKIVK